MDTSAFESNHVRFNPDGGGIVAIPSIEQWLAKYSAFPVDVPHALSWYPCLSYRDHLAGAAQSNMMNVFVSRFDRHALYLTLADSPNALASAQVLERYQAQGIVEPNTDVEVKLPKLQAQDNFVLSWTYLLQYRLEPNKSNKSHVDAVARAPLAMFTVRVRAHRYRGDIFLTPTPQAAVVADRHGELAPAIACVLGAMAGQHLGYFVQAIQFDTDRHKWNFHQAIGPLPDRALSDRATSARSMKGIVFRNFNQAFSEHTIREQHVENSFKKVRRKSGTAEDRNLAVLRLHFHDLDLGAAA